MAAMHFVIALTASDLLVYGLVGGLGIFLRIGQPILSHAIDEVSPRGADPGVGTAQPYRPVRTDRTGVGVIIYES